MPLEKLGPYRLEKTLGRGGMGAVYAGFNEATGEWAAVKVLSPHLSDDEHFRERFAGEVETLKKLKHPNIVTLTGYGQEDEHLFYVMELVEGKSLQEELQANRHFEWRETARIGIEICRALKHAHDNGVIHRDLKPANLLIDKQETIKLTDFGIAKLYGATQITAAGGVLGTADYMAPEQAEGKPVTVRSDLYSLGSVLYALLSGKPPFAARTLAEVIHGLRFEKPVSLRRLAPDTPTEFDAIILQLLEKDPAKRIPSAFAVSNLLKAMVHALSMETRVGNNSSGIDLPIDDPSSTIARKGVDLTIATHGGSASSDGATVDIPASSVGSSVGKHAGTIAGIHQQATAIAVNEEPPAPVSRFVTVEEEQRNQLAGATHDEGTTPQWLVAIGLVAVLGLFSAIFWSLMRNPSAESLMAEIEQAAENEDPAALAAVEPKIDRFFELYPTHSGGEKLRGYQERLSLQRLERNFERRMRGFLGGESRTPAEVAYLESARLATSDPRQALKRFEAIIAVFSETSDSQLAEDRKHDAQCVQLARRQAESLRASLAAAEATERRFLQQRLEEALKLEDREASAAVLAGLIELYGRQPELADLVELMRTELAKLTAPVDSKSE